MHISKFNMSYVETLKKWFLTILQKIILCFRTFLRMADSRFSSSSASSISSATNADVMRAFPTRISLPSTKSFRLAITHLSAARDDANSRVTKLKGLIVFQYFKVSSCKVYMICTSNKTEVRSKNNTPITHLGLVKFRLLCTFQRKQC